MAVKCHNCRGEIVYGTPHRFIMNDVETFWCEECIENYSAAMWSFDEPRPPGMHQVKQGKPS
jgi:hypothetical protein